MAPTTNNTTWTTPRTWSTGELVTASIMNTHVRDNLTALHVPAGGYHYLNLGADITGSSTSFADADSTNFAMTFTTGGGDVIVFCQFDYLNSGGSVKNYFDLHESVAGARIGGDDGLIVSSGSATLPTSVIVCARFPSLSAASHTFKLQYKVASGTLTIHAGAGTSTLDVHPHMWAFEL